MVIYVIYSTTTHIVLDLLLLIWCFGESCTIVYCITSQSASPPMYPKLCSIDTVDNLQPVG